MKSYLEKEYIYELLLWNHNEQVRKYDVAPQDATQSQLIMY